MRPKRIEVGRRKWREVWERTDHRDVVSHLGGEDQRMK